MQIILVDEDPIALERLACKLQRKEPGTELLTFPSNKALTLWLRERGQAPEEKRVRVQTFGNFEVFCDGKPLHFRRSRAKELFAYLIDRRGAGSTMGELLSILWEGRPDSASVRSQLRSLITDLRQAFREQGAQAPIIRRRDLLAVDPSQVDCDYYRFLAGDRKAVNAFRGEYMSNYSWAEITVGALQQKEGPGAEVKSR